MLLGRYICLNVEIILCGSFEFFKSWMKNFLNIEGSKDLFSSGSSFTVFVSFPNKNFRTTHTSVYLLKNCQDHWECPKEGVEIQLYNRLFAIFSAYFANDREIHDTVAAVWISGSWHAHYELPAIKWTKSRLVVLQDVILSCLCDSCFHYIKVNVAIDRRKHPYLIHIDRSKITKTKLVLLEIEKNLWQIGNKSKFCLSCKVDLCHQ